MILLDRKILKSGLFIFLIFRVIHKHEDMECGGRGGEGGQNIKKNCPRGLWMSPFLKQTLTSQKWFQDKNTKSAASSHIYAL